MKKYLRITSLITGLSFLLAIVLDAFTHRFFWLTLFSFNQRRISDQFKYRNGQFIYDITLNFSLLQILLPIVVTIGVFYFYKYLKTINQMEFFRNNSLKNSLIREINYSAISVGIAIFFSFILYCGLVFFLDGREIVFDSPDVFKRPLFLDWGWGNFERHHYLIYLFIEKFIAYGLLSYAYAVFGCSIVLVFRSKFISVFSPIFYYYFFIIMSYPLMKLMPYNYIYAMPSTIMGVGDYSDINTTLLLLVSFIPLLIGFVIFFFYQKEVKEV